MHGYRGDERLPFSLVQEMGIFVGDRVYNYKTYIVVGSIIGVVLLDSDFVLFVWKKYMDNVDSDRNICYGTGNKGCYGIFADSMGVWIQNRMDHEFCFSFLYCVYAERVGFQK